MTNTIPQKVYKYQPFNQFSLVNLIRRELYFSKPENFNDPYDCDPPFEITKTHRTQKNIRALYDKIKKYETGKLGANESIFENQYLTNGKPNSQFEKEFIDSPKPIREQIKARTGITCFSEIADNFLLWSHYSDKHQGFCLEFDTATLLRNYPGTRLYEVKYPKSNKPIRLNILDILNPDILELLLTRKSYPWRYEKEWRLFCNTGGNMTFGYDVRAITGVYFGQKMLPKDKDVISSILANHSHQTTTPDLSTIAKNYPHTPIMGTQINAYNMDLTRNVFEVKPSRFRP